MTLVGTHDLTTDRADLFAPADEAKTAPGSGRALRRRLVAIDAFALATGWGLVLVPGGAGVHATLPGRAGIGALAVALGLSVLGLVGMYRSRVCAVRSAERSGIARSVVATGALALALGPATGAFPASRAYAGLAVTWTLLTAQRAVFSAWLKASRLRGRNVRRVAVVGANDEARELCELLADHPEYGYEVAGIVADREEVPKARTPVTWLADYRSGADVIVDRGLSGAVVVTGALPTARRRKMIDDLLAAGVHVQVSTGLARVGHRRVRPVPVAHELLFYIEAPTPPSRWHQALKRGVDVVGASVALLVAAPVLFLAAAAIKLSDRGPILFRQERVGRNGSFFTVFKLRTMVTDAHERLAEVLPLNQRSEGPLFKASGDPRVTAVGRFLRASSIDELPQLINVIRGSMSLVGPRPALPAEVARFDSELAEGRLAVRPGITGLWQVEARDNPSYAPYRRLDLFYVENWSWGLDLYVMVATLRVVTSRAVSTALRLLRRRRVAPEVSAPIQDLRLS